MCFNICLSRNEWKQFKQYTLPLSFDVIPLYNTDNVFTARYANFYHLKFLRKLSLTAFLVDGLTWHVSVIPLLIMKSCLILVNSLVFKVFIIVFKMK